jgi:uncharacterized membrane protein YhaH (DUF805 family)
VSQDPYGQQDPSRSGHYEDYSQGYSSAPQQPAPSYGQPPYTQPTYGQAPYTQPGYGQGYQATPSYGLAPYSAALDANPRPSVTMPQAVKLWLKNWKNFSGRASQSEFWWMALASAIAGFAAYLILLLVGLGLFALTNGSDAAAIVAFLLYGLFGLVGLAAVVPSVALAVRRLHDVNQSGWMYLVSLIPFGSIVLLVLFAQPSNPAGARFDDRAQPLYGPENI